MKKKVLVLFGGVSSEHDVSLNSASSVMKNIPAEKYDVVPMGITKDGRCFVFNGSPDLLPESGWLTDESLLEPAAAKVPDDLSIVGFDDIQDSKFIYPSLTTIKQDIALKGAKAAEIIVRNINESCLSSSLTVLDTKLIIRESTKEVK